MRVQHEFDFALPGRWWEVPLDDPAATKQAIAAIARDTLGRDDARARMRIDMRRRFEEVADEARRIDAHQMYMCRELVPGVPLPSSLTVARPPMMLGGDPGASVAAGIAAMRRLLGPPPDGTDEAEVPVSDTGAVRRVRLVTGVPGKDGSAPEITSLEADYWLLQPGHRVPLLMSFGCGLVGLREQLVDLFDVIVQSVRWRPDAHAGRQVETGAG